MPVQTLSAAARPTAQGHVECRVRERHACELQASCQPVAARSDDDVHWPGTIRNISTGGVGLVLKRRFEPGAGLAIELPAVGDRAAETLLARVRHVTRLGDGRWQHGCAFISELSDEELYALLRLSAGEQSPPPPPAAPVISEVTFRGAAEDGRPVALLVRRLHTRLAWPLAPGSSLAVQVGGPDGGQVRLVVEESSQQSGRWTVRCRFVGGPRKELVRQLNPAERKS